MKEYKIIDNNKHIYINNIKGQRKSKKELNKLKQYLYGLCDDAKQGDYIDNMDIHILYINKKRDLRRAKHENWQRVKYLKEIKKMKRS